MKRNRPPGILHPTDFSDGARHALAFALEAASSTGGRLHVVHVVESPEDGAAGDGGAVLESALREYLTLSAGALGLRAPEKTSYHLIEARGPAVGILRFARDHTIDLIAMGTHGRRGMRKMIMGSVAAHVVRAARCDVATVSRRASSGGGRVLVAVDLYERSAELVRRGAEVASALKVGIDLLHVLEPVGNAVEMQRIEAYVASIGATMRQVAADRLLDLSDTLDQSIDSRIYVERGRAADEILNFIAANDSRLVVIASAGMSPDERIRRHPEDAAEIDLMKWSLGRITESIVTRSPVPVWVVKRFDDSSGYPFSPFRRSWSERQLHDAAT